MSISESSDSSSFGHQIYATNELPAHSSGSSSTESSSGDRCARINSFTKEILAGGEKERITVTANGVELRLKIAGKVLKQGEEKSLSVYQRIFFQRIEVNGQTLLVNKTSYQKHVGPLNLFDHSQLRANELTQSVQSAIKTNDDYNTNFTDAACGGNLESIKKIFSIPGVKITSASLERALNSASNNGHLEVVKYLFSEGIAATPLNNNEDKIRIVNGVFKEVAINAEVTK